ncbi:hypothetical protein LFM09_04785 [Lentzea alba]|uniref:hypothetical protein n=1 Tax=Lentzea alba TaxID=2714351 RepID=UPI0039C0001F
MKRLILLLGVLTACTAAPPPAPKFADLDACVLLASGDAGSLKSTAKADRACDYTFDSLTVRLTLVTSSYNDAAKPLQDDGGYGAVINDRAMTRRCTDASGEVTCDAVVEVRDGQVLGLKVVQRSHDPNVVGQVTQGLAAKALERLPR